MENRRHEISWGIWAMHFLIGIKDPVLDSTTQKVQDSVCAGMGMSYPGMFSLHLNPWRKILYSVLKHMEIER